MMKRAGLRVLLGASLVVSAFVAVSQLALSSASAQPLCVTVGAAVPPFNPSVTVCTPNL
jgi:hypothetical protein